MHKHFFECGHDDEKLIGIFFSKRKALQTLDDFKKIKGFKDHVEGFYIREYKMDQIDDDELKNLINAVQDKII